MTIVRKPTDAELLAWASIQRRLYAEGKLSSAKIKKLEALPGWSWIDPDTIPADPEKAYEKDFKGWPDLLGIPDLPVEEDSKV